MATELAGGGEMRAQPELFVGSPDVVTNLKTVNKSCLEVEKGNISIRK